MHRCTDSSRSRARFGYRSRSAFTLIEVTLGLAVAGVVLSGILAIASGTLQLNSEISAIQDRETKRNAFIDLCRRSFSQLSPRAGLTLQLRETGRHYLPSLVYDGAPFAFSMGGSPSGHPTTVLSTREEAGGTVQLRLQFYDAEGREQLGVRDGIDARPDREIVLLREIATLEWRFYDAVADQWETVWDASSTRPHLIELMFGFSGETPERFVFWTPKLSAVPMPLPDATEANFSEENPTAAAAPTETR